MSWCLHGNPFYVVGIIVSRSPRDIPFSVGEASCPDVSTVSIFPFLEGRNCVPMAPRYPLFRLGGGIVFLCFCGIPCSDGGGGVSCPDVCASSLFPFLLGGGRIVSRCFRGILLSVGRGGVIVFGYFCGIPFLVGGGGGTSCPDAPPVAFFPSRGSSYSDVSAVSFLSQGEGKRIPMFHWYLFFRWGVGIMFGDSRDIPFSVRKGGHLTRCPCGINFPVGGVIGSRCLRGISLSTGRGALCPDFSAVSFFFCWGEIVSRCPRCPLFRWGGGIVSRCLHGIPFPVRGGIVSRCSHGIPFSFEGGILSRFLRCIPFFVGGGNIVSRCLHGIHFPVLGGEELCPDGLAVSLVPFGGGGGASCSDVSEVSLDPSRGHCVPMFPWYPFYLGGGGGWKRIPIFHRYLFFRWGVGIVLRDTRDITFSVSRGGALYPMSQRYPFSVGGKVIVSRCLRVILFPLGGRGIVFPYSRGIPFISRGGTYSDFSSVSLFPLGGGHRDGRYP